MSNKNNFTFLFLFYLVSCGLNQDSNNDKTLDRIINHYDLRPLKVRKFEEDPKYELGKMLFFDLILSGNRDTSCATCHLISEGTSDGLKLSIGTNPSGISSSRVLDDNLEIEHPRNSLDLWNRDHNSVKSLFWDGRVEFIDPENRKFKTHFPGELPKGLENTMAVQAIFPFLREDEMLGRKGNISKPNLGKFHSNLLNEFNNDEEYESEKERIDSIYIALINRLIGKDRIEFWQSEYRQLFKKAYPDISFNKINITHVANSLSHFQELAFATRYSRWDEYLKGNKKIISAEEKKGAILFYGKGKCASCHLGPLFSDFNFHSVGIPDYGPGFNKSKTDLGRFYVTKNPNDKYRFRTSPLRNVTKTAPYFHNGYFDNLFDVIHHHNNPDQFKDEYNEDGSFKMNKVQIDSISRILINSPKLSDDEIYKIISFLQTLDFDFSEALLKKIVPEEVPSKLPIHAFSN